MEHPEAVFITGIGGFIGLRLAQRCQQLGIRVWGVDRDAAALARARELGIEALAGDITDAALMREQLAGAQAVIHTAAIVKEHGELAEFRRINVEGSRAVARAAREGGARAFVQLSSVMVYGFDFPPNVAEDGPLRGEGNPYCQTKIESEQAVLALHDPQRFGVIVIRPGDVYGPGSVPWIARPIQMLRKRRMLLPMGGRGLINHVYVDNLVDGILAALAARAYGETFNISDGSAVTYADFFGRLAAAAKVPGPRVVPTPVMQLLTRIVQALAARGLTSDEASPDTVRYLCRPHVYSIDRARRVLGYCPRIDLAHGLALTQPYIDTLQRA
jgi:nucleoside-diphosphate-sugar epimerase